MFLFVFSFLLFCRGYLSNDVNNAVALKNQIMIEKVIGSYMKPLKQLAANFPNHEVELQIELQRSLHKRPSKTPQRRFVLMKKPKTRRNNIDKDVGPVVESTSKAPATVLNPSTTSNINPETTEKDHVTIPTESPGRQLVYMDDLKKVFEEFADKIKSTTKCTGKHENENNEHQPQIVISNPGPLNDNKNINDVLELIKKGIVKQPCVQVQKHVPRPTDEDLDWLQIKIPNQ